MKHFTGKAARLLALSVVTTLFLSVSAFAAEDQLAFDTGTTTGSGLRLRSEPSTEASIVTTLEKDLVVAVLDDSVEGWYQVAYNGQTGYVSADFLVINVENQFETYGRVNASSVNVRSEPSTEAAVLASLNAGDFVTASSLLDGWFCVTTTYGTGYIRSDFLDLTNSKTSPSTATATSSGNSSIVDYAKKFLGTRYVYGGASPSGFDCSGFTMYVYKQFGVSLPHSASRQWQSGLGTRVYSASQLQPGDLVFFNDPSRSGGKACSHAAIYAGNGQIIHSSSSSSGGVIFSDLGSSYYSRYFVGGIHIF